MIRGGSITLVSQFGGVGTPGQPIRIDSGSLERDIVRLESAADGIYVEETSGDLRANSIISSGDVVITVSSGDLLDANQNEEVDQRTVDELRGGVWSDLRLTDELGAQDKVQETLDGFAANKEQEYRSYWQYRQTQTDPSTYDPGHQISLSAQEEAFYRDELLYDDNAIQSLIDARSAAYHTLHLEFGPLGDTYDPNFTYQLSPEQEAELRGGIKIWTELELIHLAGAGLLKAVTDTQVNIEEPNIVGASVTLNVAGSVGRTDGTEVIDLTSQPLMLTDDQRVLLGAAERDDIVYLGTFPVSTTVNFDGPARTITRTDGANWTGFQSGMILQVEGKTANATEEGPFYTIESVSADVIKLVRGSGLVTDRSVSVSLSEVILDPRGVEESATVSFSGNSISRTDGGDWASFEVGMTVRIDGESENATEEGENYVISSIAGGVMSLAGASFTSETDQSVVIDQVVLDVVAVQIHLREDIDIQAAGTVDVFADGQVYLGSETTLQIGRLEAGDGVVGENARIKTAQSIVSASSPGTVNVRSADLILEAAAGRIASEDAEFFIDLVGGGIITARALNDIHLFERAPGGDAGDMNVGTIYSRAGTIRLSADGSIVDGLNHEFANLSAGTIVLLADEGIGELGDYLEVDFIGNGGLTATAEGLNASGNQDIRIAETFLDLPVRNVLARRGDVDLQAHGSIIDLVDLSDPTDPDSEPSSGPPSNPLADVIGNNISLRALYGSIGLLGNELDIDSSFSAAGTLTAWSNLGNTYLVEVASAGAAPQDLNLSEVRATPGLTAFIAAPSGRILNGNSSGANVTSGKAWLFAVDDIGQVDNPLSTALDGESLLEAKSVTGNIYLENQGGVEIGGVTDSGQGASATGIDASGTVLLRNSSPITVTENIVSGEQIVIIARGRRDDRRRRHCLDIE